MTIEPTQSVDSIVYPVPVPIIIESNGLFNYEFAILSICPANKLQVLVTDREASEEDLKRFDDMGIRTVVVEKEDFQLTVQP